MTFCGSEVEVGYHPEWSGKESFRMFDDGQFKYKLPLSRHPNVLKCVIIGKKSWGLWVKQWSEGISEGSFTIEEILNEFESRGIKIPDSFLKDFINVVSRKKFGV